MNIKEQFIAFLEANGNEFEVIGENVLFNYKGRNLIAKGPGTLKSQFELDMPFMTRNKGKLINSDNGLIKQHLAGDNEIFVINLTEIVRTNQDYSFSDKNTVNALESLIAKEIDIDYETVLKKTGEFIGTITDVGKELAKTAFSSNADLLRSIADSIDPDEKEKL